MSSAESVGLAKLCAFVRCVYSSSPMLYASFTSVSFLMQKQSKTKQKRIYTCFQKIAVIYELDGAGMFTSLAG